MDTATQIRTASTITVLAGLWTAISPLFIGMTGGGLVSVILVGTLLVIAGLTQMLIKNSLPSVVSVLLAIWLVVSAFIFSYSVEAMWNVILVGLVTMFVAIWDGVETSTSSDRLTPTGQM